MSRKFKITAVAIFATLTFATTAFAGIFDVVGAVVGGVLGVQTTTTTQSQLENFHKSYLEKSASRVLETGSVDVAFNEMVAEQKKLGYTVNVTEPDADHKIAEVSGGDLPVTVKCLVNKKTQTITISYLRSDGMPTGNVLTKNYELPAGAAASVPTPAAPSDNGPSPFANVKPSDNPFANATPTESPFAGAGHQEIQKAFSAKVASSTSSGAVGRTYIHIPTVTGYAEFDNSILRGNKVLILYAYYGASKTSQLSEVVEKANYELSKVCNAKDPFAYDAMLKVFSNLFQYYRNGGKLDLYVYTVIDYKTPISGTCFHVATQNSDERNRYNTRTQNLVVNPILPEINCERIPDNIYWALFDLTYQVAIPLDVAKAAYAKINEITSKNKAASSGNKPNGKITSLRICYAYEIPISSLNDLVASKGKRYSMNSNPLIFKNATFKILAVENQYGKDNNTNWYPLVSTSASNCAIIE